VSDRLRVAVLDCAHAPARPSDVLVRALRGAGHEAQILTPATSEVVANVPVVRLRRVPDGLLRARKIGDDLAHLPSAWFALSRGGFDVAHAFTASDALAAIAWSRRVRRPAIFTCAEAVRRETVAARRLRLATLARAAGQSAAVLAVDEDVRESLWRWLAVEARVVDPGDPETHGSIYSALR
jgi:hypothetical protein